MASLILDEDFVEVKSAARRDSRGRVAVGTDNAADLYVVSRNAHGQLLLTPVVQVPAHEMWLWNNPNALDSVRRGLADAAAGRQRQGIVAGMPGDRAGYRDAAGVADSTDMQKRSGDLAELGVGEPERAHGVGTAERNHLPGAERRHRDDQRRVLLLRPFV